MPGSLPALRWLGRARKMRPLARFWLEALNRWSRNAIWAFCGILLFLLYLHRDQSLLRIAESGILRLWVSAIVLTSFLGFFAKIVIRALDLIIPSKRIQTSPVARLRAFAEFFFCRRTYSEILEPTLRDFFDEYCVALSQKRLWKAQWVRIRGYWSFWSAVFAQLPISAVKM